MNKKKAEALLITISFTLVTVLGNGISVNAQTITESSDGTSYESTTAGENAILVDGSTVTISNAAITKSGDESGDDADFYGTNAAVLATDGATLTLTDSTVTTNGSHANGVFSYGTATVNVSDTTITTYSNNSGGIMTTGGGTMNANNLTVTTNGGSSAAIRSDRGGGTVTVDGGTYTTKGVGSPAIYSTADITVSNSNLISEVSEAIVIEGGNSVTLYNDDVAGSNTQLNGQATTYQNVMIYQSMSGDASSGSGSFTMQGGSMAAENGSMFYVTNTTATISLTDVTLAEADGVFLKAAAGAWGTSGSNGGTVTLNANNQTFDGEIIVDDISSLTLNLNNDSVYTGAINPDSQAGDVYVELSSGTGWVLTADSYITGLSTDGNSITLNGHSLYIDGEAYTEGAVYSDESNSGTTTNSNSNTSDTTLPDENPYENVENVEDEISVENLPDWYMNLIKQIYKYYCQYYNSLKNSIMTQMSQNQSNSDQNEQAQNQNVTVQNEQPQSQNVTIQNEQPQNQNANRQNTQPQNYAAQNQQMQKQYNNSFNSQMQNNRMNYRK